MPNSFSYPPGYPGEGPGAFRVLFEDNHLLGVFKPIGIPCQDGQRGTPTILELAAGFLKEKYQKPGNVFVGLIHRLDQPVSGVLLLAKTSKGASRLSEQFRSRSVEKIYLAWVQGAPRLSAESLEREAEGDSPSMSLQYQVVKKTQSHSLLEVRLGTGRKHQIRQQLAEIGHPIVGDTRYGAVPWRGGGGKILLVAKQLYFDHPTREERLNLELPLEYDLVSRTEQP